MLKFFLTMWFLIHVEMLLAVDTLSLSSEPIVVVFDIGDVIADGDDDYGDVDSSPPTYFPTLDIFNIKNTSNIKEKDHFYMIRPFVSEALCWLMMKKITIVFFSGAIESRNRKLVDAFFQKKLGNEIYQSLIRQGQFAVYSRKHLVLCKEFLEENRLIGEDGQIKDPLKITNLVLENILGYDEVEGIPTDEKQALLDANEYPAFCNMHYDKVKRGEIITKQCGYSLSSSLKSLTHIGLNLNNAILVDDSICGIPLGEEEFIYLTDIDLKIFNRAILNQQDLEQRHAVQPNNFHEDYFAPYGMVYTVGIVATALDTMHETNISFRAAVAQVLPSHTPREKALSFPICGLSHHLDRKKYFEQVFDVEFKKKMVKRGMQELQEFFPELGMITKVPYYFSAEPFKPFLQNYVQNQ